MQLSVSEVKNVCTSPGAPVSAMFLGDTLWDLVVAAA